MREQTPSTEGQPNDPDVPSTGRSLPIWGFVLLAVSQQVILKLVRAFATRDLDVDYGTFPDSDTLWRFVALPVGASALFVAVVITLLGWWPYVLRDHRPVQRWVRLVPILLFVGAAVGTAYADLFDQTTGFILLFVLSMALVGFSEEGLYRGIGVTAFRASGFPEGKVALWSSVLFGLAHATNIVLDGDASHIAQVLATAVTGYFFYLTMRVTGSIVVAMLAHAVWDLALFSGNITEDAYAPVSVVLLVDLILIVTLLVRRHRIEPKSESDPTRGLSPTAG